MTDTEQAPTYECPDPLCILRSGDRVICETCGRHGCDDCIAYDECLTAGGAPEDRRQSEDA